MTQPVLRRLSTIFLLGVPVCVLALAIPVTIDRALNHPGTPTPPVYGVFAVVLVVTLVIGLVLDQRERQQGDGR